MPYLIKKIGDHYKLLNLKTKIFVNIKFKTFQSARNAGVNFMKYRNEKPRVVGNKILRYIK